MFSLLLLSVFNIKGKRVDWRPRIQDLACWCRRLKQGQRVDCIRWARRRSLDRKHEHCARWQHDSVPLQWPKNQTAPRDAHAIRSKRFESGLSCYCLTVRYGLFDIRWTRLGAIREDLDCLEVRQRLPSQWGLETILDWYLRGHS